ncbi:MAG: LpxL/LpxP family acyltransferase, partial [Panacagrimonas sp.]
MSTPSDAVAEPASIAAPVFSWRWLLPRWWLTWLGLGLMRMLSLLPINAQLALGEFTGRALGHVAGSRREVVRTNLRLCFPQMTPEERERWVNAHFAALGRGLFETTMAWFATDQELAPRAEIEGREHLDAALASGQGLLLLTGHFSSLEIGARVLRVTAKLPFHAMYRPYANPVMDYYMHRWRGA